MPSSVVSEAACGTRCAEEAERLVESFAAGARALRDALRLATPVVFLIAFAAAGFLAIDSVPCCFVFSPF